MTYETPEKIRKEREKKEIDRPHFLDTLIASEYQSQNEEAIGKPKALMDWTSQEFLINAL